jgi:hypothetical protein
MSQQEPVPASDLPNGDAEIKHEDRVDEKQKSKKKKKKKWADKAIEIEEGPYEPIPNPIDDTNCFSLLSYWWVGSLLARGFKRPLNVRKLISSFYFNHFLNYYAAERDRETNSQGFVIHLCCLGARYMERS